jgi:V-type H+-transporting ATPase subunit D
MMPANDRLKKVQGKKKRDAEAAEARRRDELAEQALQPDATVSTAVSADAPAVDDSVAVDLLSSKDEDVIF